ncbi:MAG: DNA polymerase III subunit delta [bacterium]|nr:DNA polymerase III subunit delta [Candidatus Minthenecus merdequi]
MAKSVSYQSIIKEIDKRQFQPIYMLYGDETYYIDLLSDYFENKILTNEDEREFNLSVLYGKEITVADIVMSASECPVFSDYRITIVKEAQSIDKPNWDSLVEYLKEPNSQSIVVLCFRKETIDSRLKVFKIISDKGVIFQSQKLKDYQLPDWIINAATAKGYSIDLRSAELLSEFLGSNLGKIVNEIDKLGIIMEKQGTSNITPELIERNIGISKDYNNFELISAIIKGNIQHVNRIIDYFAGNPKANSIAQTTVLLHRFFADLMIYHSSPDKSQQGIMQFVKCNFMRYNELKLAASRYNSGRTLYVIEQIRDMDAKFKGFGGGTITNKDLLRETLYKIMH